MRTEEEKSSSLLSDQGLEAAAPWLLGFQDPQRTENLIFQIKSEQEQGQAEGRREISVISKTLYKKNPIVFPFCFQTEICKVRQMESREISTPRGY